MTPKINSIAIKIKATKPKRKKVSLFLDEEIYDAFIENCEGATISVVLEELMKAFNDDIKSNMKERHRATKKK